MNTDPTSLPSVIRTERGLTLSGTRITVYDVLGYLRAGWSEEQTRNILRLSAEQMAAVVRYLAGHKQEVGEEYEQVLREAEAARNYWEERNRERFAAIAAIPPKPGTEALRAKLVEHRVRRDKKHAQPTSA